MTSLGSGDPSMRAWWKDRDTKCGQVLSPYECGHAVKSAVLCEPHDASPRHQPDIPWWELPKCQEPVAPGNNPLRFCVLHLALYGELMRKFDLPINRPGRYSTIVWDFRDEDDHPSLYTKSERLIYERGQELDRMAKKHRESDASAHLEQLLRDAQTAADAARAAKKKLEEAESAKAAEDVQADVGNAKNKPPEEPQDVTDRTQELPPSAQEIDAAVVGASAVEPKKPKKPKKPKEPKPSTEQEANGATPRATRTTKKPKPEAVGGGRTKVLPGQKTLF